MFGPNLVPINSANDVYKNDQIFLTTIYQIPPPHAYECYVDKLILVQNFCCCLQWVHKLDANSVKILWHQQHERREGWFPSNMADALAARHAAYPLLNSQQAFSHAFAARSNKIFANSVWQTMMKPSQHKARAQSVSRLINSIVALCSLCTP